MTLCTLRYEGADIGAFIEALVAAEMKVLADVRAVPLYVWAH